MCTAWLEMYAIQQHGLYSTNGSTAAIGKLCTGIETGAVTSFGRDENPHNVTGVLKRFFRMLPEPLTTAELEPRFAEIGGLDELDRLNAVVDLVRELPRVNRCACGGTAQTAAPHRRTHRRLTLETLALHLRAVSVHAEANKMTAENLAKCVMPRVLHALLTMMARPADVFGVRLFGMPLATAAHATDPETGLVPVIVRRAVDWLNKHALEKEGLYRVPGDTLRVAMYRCGRGAYQRPRPPGGS